MWGSVMRRKPAPYSNPTVQWGTALERGELCACGQEANLCGKVGQEGSVE